MIKISKNVKTPVVLLLLFVFLDFLISPVVFETRGSALLGNPSSLKWLIVLFLGLFLNIAAIALLFFRPRIGALVSVVGSILYLAVTIGDEFGFVTPLKAPIAVGVIEVIIAIVLIGVFSFASMVYRESVRKVPAGVMPAANSTPENK